MRILDIVVIVASGILAFWVRFHHFSFPSYYLNTFLVSALLTALIFPRFNVYASHRLENLLRVIQQILLATATVMVALVTLSALIKSTIFFSRTWMLLWMSFAIALLILFRTAIYLFLRFLRRKGLNQRHIVIVGTGNSAKTLIQKLQQNEWVGFKALYCLTDDPSQESLSLDGIPIKMMPKDLTQFIQTTATDEVWIVLPLKEEDKIQGILHALRHSTVNIRLLPEFSAIQLFGHSIFRMDELSIVNLRVSTMVGSDCALKWIEDKIFCLLILTLILPMLLIIAIAIRLTSRGPVLFKQNRYGWDNHVFTLFKFRTMIVHQESLDQVTQATKNDPRLTKIGGFLRRTSLDELPQFFNVLKGDMSVVGPRPHAIAHNEQYKDLVTNFMQRHRVKPGITGWAQVNGYRGETDTLEKMEKRIEYDLYYIENWSLWLDIKIIFLTILKGFINKNAY